MSDLKKNLKDAMNFLEKKYPSGKEVMNEVMKEKEQPNSLFSNPMVEAALRSMTPEQIMRYMEMGKHPHGSVNFEDCKIINGIKSPLEESLAYIVEGVKAGLHPNDVCEDEQALLIAGYGEKWYTEFGYTEDEIKK